MSRLQFPLIVKVRSTGSCYTTQAVGSHRASSTSSAEAAIGRLVDKLATAQRLPIGALRACAYPRPNPAHGVTHWVIEETAP